MAYFKKTKTNKIVNRKEQISATIDDDILEKYRQGNIKYGKGINSSFDKYYRHKKKEVTAIIGHDNVGKTFWFRWYTLLLVIYHGERFLVYSSENAIWQFKKDLIQFYTGKEIKEIGKSEYDSAKYFILQHYRFIDITKSYSFNELMSIAQSDIDNFDTMIVDPFNSLNGVNSYDGRYEALNIALEFAKNFDKTLYIVMHTSSVSRRARHGKGHPFNGYSMFPFKADVEGGAPIASRVDNVLVAHRYVSHEEPMWRTSTLVSNQKNKNNDTGGKQHILDCPTQFLYINNRFRVIDPDDKMSTDPIYDYFKSKESVQKEIEPGIKPNEDFYNGEEDEDVPF